MSPLPELVRACVWPAQWGGVQCSSAVLLLAVRLSCQRPRSRCNSTASQDRRHWSCRRAGARGCVPSTAHCSPRRCASGAVAFELIHECPYGGLIPMQYTCWTLPASPMCGVRRRGQLLSGNTYAGDRRSDRGHGGAFCQIGVTHLSRDVSLSCIVALS